jgi:hypothetical protein
MKTLFATMIAVMVY